jgi:hypothetical protein
MAFLLVSLSSTTSTQPVNNASEDANGVKPHFRNRRILGVLLTFIEPTHVTYE